MIDYSELLAEISVKREGSADGSEPPTTASSRHDGHLTGQRNSRRVGRKSSVGEATEDEDESMWEQLRRTTSAMQDAVNAIAAPSDAAAHLHLHPPTPQQQRRRRRRAASPAAKPAAVMSERSIGRMMPAGSERSVGRMPRVAMPVPSEGDHAAPPGADAGESGAWIASLRSPPQIRPTDPQQLRPPAALLAGVGLVQSEYVLGGLVNETVGSVGRSASAGSLGASWRGGAGGGGSGGRRSSRRGQRGSSVRWLPAGGWVDPADGSSAPHGFTVHKQSAGDESDGGGGFVEEDLDGFLGERRSVGLSQSFESVLVAAGPGQAGGGGSGGGRYVSRGACLSGHSGLLQSHSMASLMPADGQPAAWCLPPNGLSRRAVYQLGKDYLVEQRRVGPARRQVADGRSLGRQLLAAGQPGRAVEALLASLAAEPGLPAGDPLRPGRGAAVESLVAASYAEGVALLNARRCTEAVAALQVGLDWVVALPARPVESEEKGEEVGRTEGWRVRSGAGAAEWQRQFGELLDQATMSAKAAAVSAIAGYSRAGRVLGG